MGIRALACAAVAAAVLGLLPRRNVRRRIRRP